MLATLRPAFVLVGLFTMLCGIAAPLAVTVVAQVAFPHTANGSLVERDGKVVGSALIGQQFASARYFHPRPSATVAPDPDDPAKTVDAPYNAAASGASQRGPTSAALLDSVKERVAADGPAPVPSDAATGSGSGLGPHISPANAARQLERVATARGVAAEQVRALVAERTKQPALGFLGEPRVNVLLLNLALDTLR
jgi:K+-transporting ATPase ATPase C chain